jgi:protein-L-isoaspartate(D-aspartate) O-methyltransferase
VKEVYTIEIVEPLGRRAAATLERLGYENVHTKIGDGYLGWPEHAPFDKIIVTCSPEDIPQPLVDQLAEGGRIVVPLGERFSQTLYLFTKKEGQLQREALQATFFVPMTGTAEQRREVIPEGPFTDLDNGSFEETIDESDEPAGWYYLRQGRAEASDGAPDGGRVLTFENATPGRSAHAMQAFGVDGREVDAIDVRLHVRGTHLARGPLPQQQQAHVLVEFYDEQRAPVGRGHLGPFNGSFAWKEESTRIEVPARARLAVIGVGLFGGTGTVSYDHVTIRRAGHGSER